MIQQQRANLENISVVLTARITIGGKPGGVAIMKQVGALTVKRKLDMEPILT